MSASANRSRTNALQRSGRGIYSCPACSGAVRIASKWCPSCHFTGSHTIDMFAGISPPLPLVFDAAEVLDPAKIRKIESAILKLQKKFPQFRWRVCTVCLPVDRRLSLFGFWLFNTAPLAEEERSESREWTVLLTVNALTGEAVVTAGYAVETCISDNDWVALLDRMEKPWSRGNPSGAILRFMAATSRHLELSWKRFGVRRQRRPS